MHCVDCHFKQDNHGDGKLYGEPRNAIEIACVDCHGTVTQLRRTLVTSGPGARELPGPDARDDADGTQSAQRLELARTPFGTERFVEQRRTSSSSARWSTPGLSWEVPQIRDSVTEGSPRFNPRAMMAKLVQKHVPGEAGIARATGPQEQADLAHADANMTCQSCHSAWITSCFGCHLSQTANQKRPMLHNEGIDDAQLDRPTTSRCCATTSTCWARTAASIGGRISPVRSSSAVVVSSQDLNRQWIYYQQQTVSAEGYAGQAFNTHVPHTVRTTGNQDVHRLPRLRRRRQQRGDVAAAAARHELRELHGPVRLRRDRSGRRRGGGGHRDGRAAGGHRQRPAQARLSRAVRRAREATTASCTTVVHHGSSNALGVQVRGEYLYIADGDGRLQGLRHRADQPEGLLREDRQRAGVAARPEHEREDARRDRGRRAVDARGRSGAHAAAGERRAADSPRSTATSTSPIARKAWCSRPRRRCSTATRRTTS